MILDSTEVTSLLNWTAFMVQTPLGNSPTRGLLGQAGLPSATLPSNAPSPPKSALSQRLSSKRSQKPPPSGLRLESCSLHRARPGRSRAASLPLPPSRGPVKPGALEGLAAAASVPLGREKLEGPRMCCYRPNFLPQVPSDLG